MFKVFTLGVIYLLENRFLSILSLIIPAAVELISSEWNLFEVLAYILSTALSLISSFLPLNEGGPERGGPLRPLAFPDWLISLNLSSRYISPSLLMTLRSSLDVTALGGFFSFPLFFSFIMFSLYQAPISWSVGDLLREELFL